MMKEALQFLIALLFLALTSLAVWAVLEATEPPGLEYRWRPVAGKHCVEARQGGYYCDE